MQEALKLAIEGGYEPFKTVKMAELICEIHGEHMTCNFRPHPSGAIVKGICSANINRLLLDPLFWQSLGKALGWDKEIGRGCCNLCGEAMPESESMFLYHGYSGNCPKPPLQNKEWKKEWHRLIDHLASGKDADSFFKEITSNHNKE